MSETAIETSPDVGELAKALAVAQGKIAAASKSAINPHFNKSYADLASVWEACREPLTSNGLSVVQLPLTSGALVGVSTTLLHASGQWMRSTLWMTPERPGPQAAGSCLTYARRYALSAVAGVAPDDDDGNGATGRADPKAPSPAAMAKPGASATPAAGKTEPTTKTAPSIVKGEIPHDGILATPGQVKLLHTLKSKLGMLECDGTCVRETVKVTKTQGNKPITVRCAYHAQLAKFTGQDGKPITTSKALSKAQMLNLLARYEAQVAKAAEKTAGVRPLDMGAVIPIREPGDDDEEKPTPDELADLETAAGDRWGDSYKEFFPEWLKGAFDYDSVLEMGKQEAVDATRMIREGR